MNQEGQEVISVLKLIHDKLKDKDVNWFISGSSALFLEGLDIPVKDVYIRCKTNLDADKIYEILKEFAKYSPGYIKINNLETYMSRLSINGLDVYLLADVKLNFEGKSIIPPYIKQKIIFEGITFYIFPIKENLRIYKLLNREEDKEVIKELEKFLVRN